MIVSLHWDLREHLHELRKDDANPKQRRDARLYILTYLALRANLRLRCWPSTKSICKDTGYSQPMVVEARNWLIEHQAIVCVPYEKRVGAEEKLPVRQMVYQLTGILKLACGFVPYLAMSPDMIEAVQAELTAIGGEVVAIKTSVAKTLAAKPKGIEESKGIEEKDSAPIGTDEAPVKPKANPWYDAVQKVWGYTAARNTIVAQMLQGKARQKGYKEYNLEKPITPDDLLAWAAWYRRAKLKNNTKLSMIEEPRKVQSSIGEWQALQNKAPAKILTLDVSATDYPDAADFLPLDENGNYLQEGA
jgi:hypothetical protein